MLAVADALGHDVAASAVLTLRGRLPRSKSCEPHQHGYLLRIVPALMLR